MSAPKKLSFIGWAIEREAKEREQGMLLRLFVIFGLGFFLLFAGLDQDLAAAKQLKASGVLQAVESDGKVMIDQQILLLSPNLRVYDGGNREILLHRLEVPVLVAYSYRYTTRGVVIDELREIPQ